MVPSWYYPSILFSSQNHRVRQREGGRIWAYYEAIVAGSDNLGPKLRHYHGERPYIQRPAEIDELIGWSLPEEDARPLPPVRLNRNPAERLPVKAGAS
jgi:hypothetical protein